MSVSLEQFAKGLAASGLMTAEEIKAFHATLSPEKRQDAPQFATELVRQGKLTRFQAASIYQGNTANLVMGDYRVLELIGTGGMGQVFKAQHRRMKRIVALKLLPAEVVKDAQAVKRFQREVETAARLIHPHIVTAYDAGEHQGVHYLIMEFVDGQDLATLVKRQGTLPIETAVSFIAQAARGLEHAHTEGVIHRDIKPGNLLVDRKGTIKILDMGLARTDSALASHERTQAADGLTDSGVIMGTVDYMSPEQATDTRLADHRSDIYSLGCTLFYLLTGRRMFEGDTFMKRILAHRENSPPSVSSLRPDMPASLEAIFERMVAKRPEERYQAMAAVRLALEKCLAKMEGADDSSSVLHLEKVQDDDLASFLRGMKAQAGVGTSTQVRLATETTHNLGLETRADSRSHNSALGGKRLRAPIAAIVLLGATAVAITAAVLSNRPPVDPVVNNSQPPVPQPNGADIAEVAREAPDGSNELPFTKKFDTARPAPPVEKPVEPPKPAEKPEKSPEPVPEVVPAAPKRIVVGVGAGEIKELSQAIEQAAAGDTIVIRHRGPLAIPPMDLASKSPLTIEGDRLDGVDYWPLLVQSAPKASATADPGASLPNVPALLYADHLDLTLKRLHLAAGGPALEQVQMQSVFALKSGRVRIEECSVTVGGEAPVSGPGREPLPLICTTSSIEDEVQLSLARCFVRGPVLGSCLSASGAGSLSIDAQHMLWAGAAMPWVTARDNDGPLVVNILSSTLYNLPSVLRWEADALSSKASFSVRHSLLVGPYANKEPLVQFNPADAQADLSKAATSRQFSWDAEGNVYHRFEGYYREPRAKTLATLAKWRALWQQSGAAIERESDPYFRVWPADYVLQECNAWDFESRFWRNREKTRQIAEQTGADVAALPAALPRSFNRPAATDELAAKPRGLPRTLRVHQKEGPYKTIEAALVDVADGDVIEIGDDGPYTPRRNFTLNPGEGVLTIPVDCLTLRAGRNASPVIILRDELQEGVPKAKWIGEWMVYLTAGSGNTAVLLDGLHFRFAPAPSKYRMAVAGNELGLLRVSNCSFSMASPGRALFMAGNPPLLWLENNAFLSTALGEDEMLQLTSKGHSTNTDVMLLIRNCLSTAPLFSHWSSSGLSQAHYQLALYNNTILGRIGAVARVTRMTTQCAENLVLSPEAVFKFEDDNVWRNAEKRGERNALWIGGRPLTEAERGEFTNSLLPGPPLKTPPTFEAAVGSRDPLRRFRPKRTSVLAADGGSVGARLDYLPDVPVEN